MDKVNNIPATFSLFLTQQGISADQHLDYWDSLGKLAVKEYVDWIVESGLLEEHQLQKFNNTLSSMIDRESTQDNDSNKSILVFLDELLGDDQKIVAENKFAEVFCDKLEQFYTNRTSS